MTRPGAVARDGGCRTKPCTKTWAALAVMAVEGPGSTEAEQSVPRPSDDLRGFRPHPQNDSSEGFRGLCDALDDKEAQYRARVALLLWREGKHPSEGGSRSRPLPRRGATAWLLSHW